MNQKERKWLEILDSKKTLKGDDIYFKEWYMNHSLDWMDGFNKAIEIMLRVI